MPDISPTAWREARIEAVIPDTPRVKRFILRPAAWGGFHPGQHVDIRLTAPDGYTARRPYSIISAPETRETIELAIERLEEGEVSPYFHEVAAVGDRIDLRGPLGGHFAWKAGDGGPVLMVAGGSGVAPFLSMIRHRRLAGGDEPLTLLYSTRDWDEVILRDELLALDAVRDGTRVLLALTRGAAARSNVTSGRIDAARLSGAIAESGPPRYVFVCGSNRFVEAMTDHLLDLGMAPGRIRTERFGGAI